MNLQAAYIQIWSSADIHQRPRYGCNHKNQQQLLIFVMVLFLSLIACVFSLSARGDARLLLRSPLFLLGAVYGTASIVAACGVSLREKAD